MNCHFTKKHCNVSNEQFSKLWKNCSKKRLEQSLSLSGSLRSFLWLPNWKAFLLRWQPISGQNLVGSSMEPITLPLHTKYRRRRSSWRQLVRQQQQKASITTNTQLRAASDTRLYFLEPFCLLYHGKMTCSAATFLRYGLFMHSYNGNGSRCFEQRQGKDLAIEIKRHMTSLYENGTRFPRFWLHIFLCTSNSIS